jgi:hypothetical protein
VLQVRKPAQQEHIPPPTPPSTPFVNISCGMGGGAGGGKGLRCPRGGKRGGGNNPIVKNSFHSSATMTWVSIPSLQSSYRTKT